MTQSPLTFFLHRAGITSVRDLAELTGISKSSVDRIIKNPRIARGYQLDSIAQACGMSEAEIGRIIKEGR